ncbi:MAG: hypothetical protein E7Z91_00675 [Cyanobacteria bacterium SIG30]|nr:hypothetical protein [Cyanobacteria bacterium SIG30]
MNTSSVSFGSEPLALQVANAQKTNVNNVKPNLEADSKTDSVEISAKGEKKQKKGILDKFANFVGSLKKIGTNIKEYGVGGVKAVVGFAKGAVAGVGAIFVIDKIKQGIKASKETGTNAVKEVFSKLAKGVSKNFTKEGFKSTLKTGKGKLALLGGIAVGAFSFVKQIYIAKLNANEKNAMIDHRYTKTPVVSK